MRYLAIPALAIYLCLSLLGCSKHEPSASEAPDALSPLPASNWTYGSIPGNSHNPPILTATTTSINTQSNNAEGGQQAFKLVLRNSTKIVADVDADDAAQAALIQATRIAKTADYDFTLWKEKCVNTQTGYNYCSATEDGAKAGAALQQRAHAADIAATAAENAADAADQAIDNDGMVAIAVNDSSMQVSDMIIEARFDDGDVQTFEAFVPGDSAPGEIFIKYNRDCVSQIYNGKHVSFAIPMNGKYQEVDFNISGLDATKLAVD